MLSDEERKELKAMAASASLREEFRLLKAASQLPLDQPVDLDTFVRFLSTMSRFSTVPPQPRPFVAYTNVKL